MEIIAGKVRKVELNEDLQHMLISAVRYAMGRRTYVVSWTVSYIMPLIPDMDTKVLTIMKRDYEEAPSLGDACDKSDWDRFYDAVFTELEKRGEIV